MLDELLGWFTGKEPNRRKYPRKRKPYRATVSVDGGVSQRPAIGLDISGGGLCLLTQEPTGLEEFEVRATIETRSLRMRAKSVWQDTVTHQGKSVWRYGMRFTGISADDWDSIIRYTTDRAVAEANKAQEELVSVRMTPDDASRLLPIQLQRVLLAMLVERRRLAPLQDNVTPLVQYFYSGVVRFNNALVHRLTIQSKVVGPEGAEMYETRFVFDDQGGNIQILN
ncbi:MAG: PilZ domain-containing protein [Candidatus Eremiobacteraeota bacterium]|nr:PilZ domain-containing protein [Candidatus Eremiobacteraeota bacterium]MBV8433707.1 PilZ domain-containing protein [Candidatus Eremiobacteraeota bacterium]MBV8723328.1 PilZ domain-containing protein [Candidatus Eremiobacteraeota bacterium]